VRERWALAAFQLAILALAAPPHAAAQPLFRLLPGDKDVAGWTRGGQPRLYEHTKLWEYIDGGADVYIDYGFQRVATADLAQGKRSITVDVYEFATLEGAFGMYARERAPAYHYIAMGAEGYQEGTALNFYQGRYYVKLTGFASDQATASGLQAAARFVSGRIGGPKAGPAQLALFPPAGRTKHAETYERSAFLGRAELRESWVARFAAGGRKYTLFFAAAASPSAAVSRLRALRPALSSAGSHDKLFAGLGTELLTGRHREAGDLALVVRGNYIVGLYPATEATKPALVAFLKKFK
jgi:hypothetical protein